MASNGTKAFGIVAVVVAMLVYMFNRNNHLQDRLDEILSGLLQVETQADIVSKPKIAIGFGACQDLVVQAVDLLTLDENSSVTPAHYDVINTREELNEGFAYFFLHGAAAERYIGNSTLFNDLITSASKIKGARRTLGGNAPVMGSRFAKEGCNVLLGASMSKELRQNLHPDIEVTGENLQSDDVHLILEYPTGEFWGTFQSPRANRFIIHNDNNNPKLVGLENFQKRLVDYKPDILIISGLQMMDNYPFQPGERYEQLKKIQEIMISQRESTKIHFEMASFSDVTLLHELAELIMPNANSLGMNEQELTNLYTLLFHGNVSLVSDAHPRIAAVLDQMRVVFRLLRSENSGNERSQLTRLHVHTLAYQAIMVEKHSPWKNIGAAAAKASLTAHRHTCGSTVIDLEKAQLLVDESFTTSQQHGGNRMPFDPKNPVVCWSEDEGIEHHGIEICIAPVLVCTKVLQTAGGGDNISSAGLVLQI